MRVGELIGVLIAIVSSCLGGTAAAVTRYLVGNADPLTLAILRWGIGFLFVLPITLVLRVKWPPRSDWPGVAALGLCFFGLFFILYNIALGYTTAARASLALSTLPLQTMPVGVHSRHRTVDDSQVRRRRHRRARRFRRARVGSCRGSMRGLARRVDHDRRGALHGVLQCLVARLHSALKRAGISRRRHGGGRRGADCCRPVDPPGRGAGKLRRAAVDRRIYLGIGGVALAFILWVWPCSGRRRRASPIP